MLCRKHAYLSHELDAIGSLFSTPAAKRSILVLLNLRKVSCPSSPVMHDDIITERSRFQTGSMHLKAGV
eukprot:CAMPEP_0198274358 /NCGR_PEP_ID=MMETSP1447-20131203/60131_1 /TAXON_ID=420782 /ORGANISM="Chaetoceros dichaeta, Strain CCMP1751" /LENGTH=68 /DNA_ID=CAMNT_0043968481 /DNA_START=184 /DNA_END=390 /DNA_ORIENTATION=-